MPRKKQQTARVRDVFLDATFILRDGDEEFILPVSINPADRSSEWTTHTLFSEDGACLTVGEADEVAERFGYADCGEMANHLAWKWWDGKFGPESFEGGEFPL